MNSKILSMLGISRKAGFAVLGFDKAKDSLLTKKAKIVCLCSDISEKTKKEIIFFADKHNIPVLTVDCDMFEMSNAVGMKTGIVAVTDKGIADKIIALSNSTAQ